MRTLSSDTPFFIIINLASGSGDGRAARDEMQEILSQQKRHHEFFVVQEASQLRRTAERAVAAAVKENGAVIVAGGDGTINTAAQVALPAGRPFGIVPQGTFNYTTRDKQIPLDVKAATLSLCSAALTPKQVGLVNGRVFLVNASLGLYPELLKAREAHKQRFGRRQSVAIGSGLLSLMRHHRQLHLEIEHDQQRETVRTPALFVGNNAMQLERLGLPEADVIERRQLAGVIVRPVRQRSLLWLALRGALGQLAGSEHVRDFPFQRLVVETRRRNARVLEVAADGEVLQLPVPLVFSVSPQDLLLMTPSAKAPEAAA